MIPNYMAPCGGPDADPVLAPAPSRGEVVALPARRPRPARAEPQAERTGAQILLFTGVRYERLGDESARSSQRLA